MLVSCAPRMKDEVETSSQGLGAGPPVREDADLLELLAVCDLGDEIPPELYSAVAELLSYLFRLNASLAPESE